MTEFLEHALQYVGRGWRVFPVHSVIKGKCTCGRDCGKNAGKHPRIKGGCNAASVSPEQIAAWWKKWPKANIGIATGAVSGLVVLDLDGAKGVAKLKALLGTVKLPPTACVATGRGWHLYFRALQAEPTGCSSDGGLDVRGEGGYVIAPPSIHASGARYRWINPQEFGA